MAKAGGKKDGIGGIAIPIYLETESFKESLAKLPNEINTFLKYVRDSLNIVELKYKINIIGETNPKTVANEYKKMVRDSLDITSAAREAFKTKFKDQNFSQVIPLKLELQEKTFSAELNKNATTFERFSDKLKGILNLPKLDLDISTAKGKLKDLESQAKQTQQSLNELNSSAQGGDLRKRIAEAGLAPKNGKVFNVSAIDKKIEVATEKLVKELERAKTDASASTAKFNPDNIRKKLEGLIQLRNDWINNRLNVQTLADKLVRENDAVKTQQKKISELTGKRESLVGSDTTVAQQSLAGYERISQASKRIQREIDVTKNAIKAIQKEMDEFNRKGTLSLNLKTTGEENLAKLRQKLLELERQLSSNHLNIGERITAGLLNVDQALKHVSLPNINDVYKKAYGAVAPVFANWQNDIMGVVDATQSFPTAVDKAFSIIGNAPSLAQATEGLTGFSKAFAAAGVVVNTSLRVFSAGVVAIAGFENSLVSLARPALEAQNALYIMSLGMHSTIDDMKQLSVITQVAGVGINSVQVALRRVNAQLAKTTEGSKTAKETLKFYGANLFDERGNMKQGMAQLDEIAKAYRNAMALGKGAEFRYRVGGRYWDNDFVALIADYAANKESMHSIVKSNLADPALAYSVRGSMYALEAQIKQFKTAFSSAFMPVVEHIAPQMRDRFAELTRIIELNAPAIKGLGFAVGGAVEKVSAWGSTAAKAISTVLRMIDFANEERIASEVLKTQEKAAGDLSNVLLGIKKDSSGEITEFNKKNVDLFSKDKLDDYATVMNLFKKIIPPEEAARELINKGTKKVKGVKLDNININYDAFDIEKNLEKALNNNRWLSEREKENARAVINRSGGSHGDRSSKNVTLANLAVETEQIKEYGGVEKIKALGNLYENIANSLGDIDTERLSERIVEALENFDEGLLNALDISVEEAKKFKDAINAEVKKRVHDELINQGDVSRARDYTDYARYGEFLQLVDEEQQAMSESKEALEKFRNSLTVAQTNLLNDYKDNITEVRSYYQSVKSKYRGFLKDIEETEKQVKKEVYKSVVLNSKKQSIIIKNKEEATNRTGYSTVSNELTDIKLAQEKREKEIKSLELDISYGNYPLARSIEEVTRAYQTELDTLNKLEESLNNVNTAEDISEEQKAKAREEITDARKATDYYYKELKLAALNKQFSEEIKQIAKSTYDTIYALSHSAIDKELSDIRQWRIAEAEKIELLEDEGQRREKISAVTAKSYAKEMEVLKKLKDEMFGNITSYEETIFDFTASQYEKDLYEMERQAAKFKEQGRTDEEVELYRQLRKAQLKQEHKGDGNYYQPKLQKPKQRNPNKAEIVYGDSEEDFSEVRQNKAKFIYGDEIETPRGSDVDSRELYNNLQELIKSNLNNPETIKNTLKAQEETAAREYEDLQTFAKAYEEATGKQIASVESIVEVTKGVTDAYTEQEAILKKVTSSLSDFENSLPQNATPKDNSGSDSSKTESPTQPAQPNTVAQSAENLSGQYLAYIGNTLGTMGSLLEKLTNKLSTEENTARPNGTAPKIETPSVPQASPLDNNLFTKLVNDVTKYLPSIDTSLKPIGKIGDISGIAVKFEKICEKVENALKDASNNLSQLATKIKEKLTQPINVTVSPTINLNLNGSYILTQQMVNAMQEDITTEVAESIEKAVSQAVSGVFV